MSRKQLSLPALLVFVMVLLGVSTAVVYAAPADKDRTDASWWWGDGAGSAKIVRNDSGISGNWSSSLANSEYGAKGLAVTLWVVVFNNPDACATSPCGESDLFESDVMADVLYGAGNVVGNSEKARFGYHRSAGDNAGSIAHLFGMPMNDGEPWGLLDPRGAEIHLVLRTHGPKVSAHMPAQIQTFEGGCVVNAPFGYMPPASAADLHFGEGECQDVQAAIFQP